MLRISLQKQLIFATDSPGVCPFKDRAELDREELEQLKAQDTTHRSTSRSTVLPISPVETLDGYSA